MLLIIRFWGVQRKMVHSSNSIVFPDTLDSAEKGVNHGMLGAPEVLV